MNYKVVCSIEFPDGHMEYVTWEPEFYGTMIKNNVDIRSLFYDIERNGFSDSPVDVLIELYEDPKIQTITQRIGDNEFQTQLLIGKNIFPIIRY